MQVRHILQSKGRDVVAVAADARFIDAARLLSERRIGALIVKDGAGALAGIISERDLVHAIARKGASALDQPVSAFMTPGPATCVESDTVETIMEVMTHGRFRHVPVLDGNEQLCGMISIGDVVKTRIAETVNEAAALRDYISATA
ncbi:MAG TPA: CBS domain-containing protein [Phycisphaerae bacterium]|jgi:CBS domain-containing protein|nr:CBS domain-containing protein [Phycisphaerae bacterium]